MHGLREAGEALAEALEDKSRLEADCQHLCEEISIADFENRKLKRENAQIEVNLGYAEDTLEELDKANKALTRAVEKLTLKEEEHIKEETIAGGILGDLRLEKAAAEGEVATLKNDISSLKEQLAATNEKLDKVRTSTTAVQVENLSAHNWHLWNELTQANGQLDHIRTFLNRDPKPAAQPDQFDTSNAEDRCDETPAVHGDVDPGNGSTTYNDHSESLMEGTVNESVESFEGDPAKEESNSSVTESAASGTQKRLKTMILKKLLDRERISLLTKV